MLASANSFSKDNVSRTDRFSPPELVAVMPSGEFSSFKFAHLIKTIPKSDREEASSPSPKLNQKKRWVTGMKMRDRKENASNRDLKCHL